MVIDVVTFNGEYELFDIRYNILKDYVDEFIVVEFNKTFSGNDKPFYFDKIYDRYSHGDIAIKYHKFTEKTWNKYKELAENSPNTAGANHWKMEFMQKECIKDALTHPNDDDLVFVGDVDEIWNPEHLAYFSTAQEIEKMKLWVCPYYLNNLSNEEFWGTIYGKYKDIKDECLNHLRTNAKKTLGKYGWHFTSQGGLDEVRRKLNDSYTAESYNTAEVQKKLEERFKTNKDYIGRGFTFTKDERELPQYLLDNKEKYAKLFLK